MGKLDIGVGDEFPVDEPAPPSPEDREAARATREEWHHQRDEWRRRKQEWRAQRDAWRADMRSRREAFKSDLRESLQENFGPRTYKGQTARYITFLIRFGVVISIVVLALLLLPFLFMFGFVVLAAVLAFMAGCHHHHDYPSGTSNPSR